MIELFDQTLAYQAVAQVLGKGYSPVDYTLLCYGGGGRCTSRGLQRRRALPRRARSRLGGGGSPPSAAPAATTPTART